MIYELPDRIGFSLRFFSLTHGTKGATKMKRLLTAGIFGTILGIVGAGTANASIVSSGFLDEKLTEYALSTSLDLKANQSDLTELNDIVGKETWDDFLNLKLGNFPNYSELFFTDNDPNKGLGIDNLSQSTLINFTITGFPTLAGVTDKFLHGWTNSDRLTRQGLIALNDGWTDKNDGTTYLGVKDINTKIGDLPTEYATVGAALTAIKGIAEDAKAAALAAIPDPKQEGSSGKFVLTVDIVGDNATYHWEKIDREGETTTTE